MKQKILQIFISTDEKQRRYCKNGTNDFGNVRNGGKLYADFFQCKFVKEFKKIGREKV